MSNKENNTEQPITDISIYIAALQKTYAPCTNASRCHPFLFHSRSGRCHQGNRPIGKDNPNRSFLCPPQCRFRFLQSPWLARVGIQMVDAREIILF